MAGNRVTLNVNSIDYLNIAKNFVFTGSGGGALDINNISADGYPVAVPSGTWLSNPSFPLGYYGQYVWKWSGTGAMVWIGAPPLIVTASTVNGVSSGVIYELAG